jgi:flagellar biosynthesis regulator FlbT
MICSWTKRPFRNEQGILKSDGATYPLRRALQAPNISQGHGIHFRLFRATDEVVLTYFETPEVCQDCRIVNTNISESTLWSATEIHPGKL